MTRTRALRGPFDYRLPEELRARVGIGSMLVVPFGRREILGVVTALREHSDLDEARLLAPLRALDGDPPAPPTLPADLVALARWLADEYCSTFARALALVLPPAATRRLSGRRPRRARALPEQAPVGRVRPVPELTAEQAAAVQRLSAALAGEQACTRLLVGVTGSGKTEVYLRATERALSAGRGAIVLVPEIALTPQTVARFIERFGETVAVLHSRLTLAQRREQWRRLRHGEARVCVGPRSAVFAPIERLGLIVLDEEHDSSYKHEGDPRYDARTVAAKRAADCGAVLLLGSATPRPETVQAAGADGVLRLSSRVDRRPLPAVQVLDMRECDRALHPASARALAELRAHGGKAIVMLNRRGWSNFLTCRSCGQAWFCPHCDVALVLHRSQRILACHHCGHREPVPSACVCGSTAVARHGAGTERLAHELTLALGESFPVLRLDADTADSSPQGEGGLAALLGEFERAPRAVLVGTQMVAKGHDFADVSLGLVLDADATLRFPDFRAEERTFALVCQLAGRIGRGGEGRVLVQTLAPQARAIQYAARHDSDGFLAEELKRRRALDYPPFSSLVRIVCACEQAAPARAAALRLRAELLQASAKDGAGDGVQLLGPAPLFRLRGRERQQLVLKIAPGKRSATVRAVGEAVRRLAGERAHRQVALSVDVDPQ